MTSTSISPRLCLLRRLRALFLVATALCLSACANGDAPEPREFVEGSADARGNVDRLLVGPGVALGQVTVDRVTLADGESAFDPPRVAAGTVTFFVVEGEVDVVAAEIESTLGENEVATFAAGLEHQLTATNGPATVFMHTANPRSERRTDGEG